MLRSARQDANLSQSQLANRLGLSQGAISQWETGTRSPTVEDLYRVADELGLEINDLLPRKRTEARAALRAVVANLEWTEMRDALEHFLSEAEVITRPEVRVGAKSTEPADAAAQLLDELQIVRPPVDVILVASQCGVPVVTMDVDNALSGLIVEFDQGPVIGINGADTVNRQRFSIAHELGHFVLKHLDTFHVDLSTSSRDGDPPNYNWRHERAANAFAASLLMPESLVRRAFIETTSSALLAEIFEVSVVAMGFRLQNLGLSTA